MPTRSQLVAYDVAALLRSRAPVLWIVTREEARVEKYILEAAGNAGFPIVRTWDTAQGVCPIGGKPISNIGGPDIGATLESIKARSESENAKERCVWILRDAHLWLEGLVGAQPNRMLRNLARSLPLMPSAQAHAVVIISASARVPDELAGQVTLIEWPLPDREEISAILSACLEPWKADERIKQPRNGEFAAAVDAAVGLTGEEAQACYAKSLVQMKRIDPQTVSREKRRVIEKDKLLQWIEPLPGGIDALGGLDALKGWLLKRATAFSPKAKARGLPAPKGILLVGPPGTGKSLTAKVTASILGEIPLIRWDISAAKSKFVGDSEANFRKAQGVISAVGRCVIWIDEIEKALAGATQGAADGGVSADALGSLLTWMQERQGEAFVVATANDAESLPPELMRKGRFDEIFFVDMPNDTERCQITLAALAANKLGPNAVAVGEVAIATEGFTGSEIAALVPAAMFNAFADGDREITTADLVAEAKATVPLSKTAAAKIEKLREWANGKARLATTPVEGKVEASAVPALDLI